jgi:hypothetical protein
LLHVRDSSNASFVVRDFEVRSDKVSDLRRLHCRGPWQRGHLEKRRVVVKERLGDHGVRALDLIINKLHGKRCPFFVCPLPLTFLDNTEIEVVGVPPTLLVRLPPAFILAKRLGNKLHRRSILRLDINQER